ncbi:MAG: hypothetical protein IPN70_04765 [Candidatus Moraniibacteriota bacterium]|nr:MAG: hypothetical protein IPN70_04765 [Candidatus Moranbacteria bacterium]
MNYKLQDGFLVVHDSPVYHDKVRADKEFFFLWNEGNFGFADFLWQGTAFFPRSISFFLFEAGFNSKNVQLILYFVAINFIWYFSWWSFKGIYNILDFKNVNKQSFLAATFYTFNLYMIITWHAGISDFLFILFAIAPLILKFFIKTLLFDNTKIIYQGITFGLFISFLVNTGPFFLAMFLPFLVSYLVVTSLKGFSIFFYKIKLLIISFFVVIFLAAPFILLLFLAHGYTDKYWIESTSNAFIFSDAGLDGIFRLFLEYFFDKIWFGRFFHSYYPYYESWLAIGSIYTLWICGLFGMFYNFKNKTIKDKYFIIFIIFSLLIALFMAKANQLPLGSLNEYLYEKVPVLALFRTPDTKFGLPIILILSLIIGYFTLLYRKNKLVISFISFLIILQVGIFFSGIPIIEKRIGDGFQRIVVIPEEYKNIANILNRDRLDGSIFMCPDESFFTNFDYGNGFGLNGPDILGEIIERPVIYGNGLTFGRSLKKYNFINNGSDVDLMNIRYFLIRKDIIKNNKELSCEEIYFNNSLKEIYNSSVGTLFINKLDNENSNVIFSDKDNNVIVHKVSPLKYEIKVSHLSKKTDVEFLQSFHDGWKFYPGTDWSIFNVLWKKDFFQDTHRVFNGYANKWTIDPKYIKENFPKDSWEENPDGSINVALSLYFKPQSYFYASVLISGISFFACISYLIFFFIKRKKINSNVSI